MIVAHHMGENLIPTLVAGGAAVGPALLIVLRARLSRVFGGLRRQSQHDEGRHAAPAE